MIACWEVGTDIGGTFTDIVAVHGGTRETRTAKVPSRPDAPVEAMLAALGAVGLAVPEVRRFVHGTTRITNAIVQDRLPAAGLVATAGFEDVLEIGRYRRRDLYRLDVPPKAPPLVPRERCFGLRARMDHRGRVVEALTDGELARVRDWVAGLGVASVAVCLLHSYANPAHELRVGEALAGVVAHVSLSHQVNPEAREYERASSTATNAAAMPIAVEYLSELERRIPLGAGLQVFHSAGGMVPVAVAKARPIGMAMSGPAAGVAASVAAARGLGLSRVLTFDMGGTTTDVCLIVDGQAAMADAVVVGDRPLRQPMLAVHSIGAGGGSIVTLGAGGVSVGPASAGAEPGPACYGRGGVRATVTDANVVLGYLEAGVVLGGSIRVDRGLAEAAIAPVAAGLGVDVVGAALGIVQVAHATMARALRRVTVERGIDGRDCVLLAFGGGGPMHAAGLAEMYGIGVVVVPPGSSAFSALGCLVAEPSFVEQRTVRLALHTDRAVVEGRIAEMTAAASGPLDGDVVVEHTAMMRYAAQSDATGVAFSLPFDAGVLGAAFRARHEALYGYSTDEEVVIEGLRVVARAGGGVVAGRIEGGGGRGERSRVCSFMGAREVVTRVLDRDGLAGAVAGPAIIGDAWSTVVVPPGWVAAADAAGNLVMRRGDA